MKMSKPYTKNIELLWQLILYIRGKKARIMEDLMLKYEMHQQFKTIIHKPINCSN